VPGQKRRHLLLEVFADVAGIHRTPRLHQNHSTGFGEPGLSSAVLAVDQLHQFLIQNGIAEKIGQSGDGLLDRTNSLHDLGSLMQQLTQFVVRLPDHFLHVAHVISLD